VAEFLLILRSNTFGSTDHNLKELYKNSEKASTGLRIGVLASNPELYSNKRIMEAGEMRGHEMHFLNIKECATS
jgi:ribosomal protein S6--L-glutamate ligase